jgi:D-beta-D-heptose 7-phosphate kinase/D-beta-D-heptose 1-phosphate adenosyltransferase
MRINRAGRLLENKIKSLAVLTKIVRGLKRSGKKIVFTNGCFDLMHFGHAKYLQEAAKKGDILVVAVNSDSSVKKIKAKGRPIIDEYNRLRLVAALESVDYVVKFSEDTPIKVIAALKPDVLVKGADWNKLNIVGSDLVRSCGGRVSTVKLVNGLSTSNLIKKIAKTF